MLGPDKHAPHTSVTHDLKSAVGQPAFLYRNAVQYLGKIPQGEQHNIGLGTAIAVVKTAPQRTKGEAKCRAMAIISLSGVSPPTSISRGLTETVV